MQQILIVETSQQAFTSTLDRLLREEFRFIAGSYYIKSLPTSIAIATGQVLNDIDHVFSLAITGSLDSVVFSKNIVKFREEVNYQLKTNAVVVGSIIIEAVFRDCYEPCKRAYTTYYCCCLYRG